MVLSQFDSIAHLRPPFPKGDHRGIHASQLRSAESSLTPCFVGLFANSAIAVPPVVETTGYPKPSLLAQAPSPAISAGRAGSRSQRLGYG